MQTGTFTFTVKLTDASFSTDTKQFSITVSEPTGGFLPKMDISGGGCFIATAAYGSALHPHVNALRNFRDNHLKKSATGQAIVSVYKKVSPPLANLIARHDTLRLVSRVALAPLVYGIVYQKVFGFSMLLLLVVFFAACSRARC